MLRRCTTDSEASPDERLRVENSDIVEIALLQRSTLLARTSSLHVLLIEPETTMDDEVRANQNGTVALAWARRWTRSVRLVPGHHLQVKHVNIIEEVSAVPATEDYHLGSVDQVGGVIKPCSWGTATLWTLEPSHSERVKRMQVSEDGLLAALSSENDNTGTSEHCRVSVARWGRRTRDPRLDPAGRVNIQDVRVV